MRHLFPGVIATIPAGLFGCCVLTFKDEYYWLTYLITSLVFISTSFVLGTNLPGLFKNKKFDFPSAWFFTAGALGWLTALICIGLLNLTPLCIGQDNGDGINDYSLCVFYSLIAGIIYSPGILGLILVNALVSGKVLSKYFSQHNQGTN